MLKAKISLALLDELGRRPTEQEVERFFPGSTGAIQSSAGTTFPAAATEEK
jgi:hypothetical protein